MVGSGIIDYCNRPFTDIDEMNEKLVDNWNNIVSNDDTIYVLGDLTLGNKDGCAEYWVPRLNGYIILIKGNHDWRSGRLLELGIDEIHPLLDYDGVYMIHDPMAARSHGLCLCGHVHDAWDIKLPGEPMVRGQLVKKRHGLTVNVGVDIWDYKPISLDWLLNTYLEGRKWR